ncbi:pantoate--beta-alanine ligase [Roseinatronobacter bogoriensis]|uniref:Pantothenate synthetase n=1 Tax=Roseinatronobacter bogoriensis subsp. barguzinensis TaxID=441209 RepID=A0A2K8K784_9RHOB|nr:MULTISPECIES: pantoate--beta-alanine ligase [Rhodobaca]ATX64776.1 pantoate--beta-alanine ligase [Rhodobaca barguzinensis]MBB4208558.1 pantoate--beta-alanine ligase [Rhodobaca bogoriensis DSM 18756]TDW38173.1 pantothenate synthetase [Rhodobaca barguzinensis]TDY69656.1 pantothenate synthetase [Rhodobaca bogoriensis DSM 18756]
MKVCRTKAAIRAEVSAWRAAGADVVLVPTMGFLHEGHLSLMRLARARAGVGGKVVTSIFVNPTQFGPGEDLDSYPRDEARDLALLQQEGVDAVFAPDVGQVYDPQAQTIVETTELSRVLIGKLRPGHFRGVATVVTKLFNIIRPDAAVFGEKDFQQLAVIRTMVRDLDMEIEIIGGAIAREADGLAMSSRNVRLSPADRAAAPVLARALDQAAEMAPTGVTASRLRSHVRAMLEAEPRASVQSVDIRDAVTLDTIAGPLTRPAVILLAVKFGQVFLIDNRVLYPTKEST